MAKFLCTESSGVPRYILDLPQQVLQTPFGAMLKPLIEQMTPQGQSNMEQSSVTGSQSTSMPSGKVTLKDSF